MKIQSFSLFFLVLSSVWILPAAAFTPSDPQDPVYSDLARWEALGLTGPLPSLKPYNLKFMKTVLERIQAAGGSEGDAAAAYLKDISAEPKFSVSKAVSSLDLSAGTGESGSDPLRNERDLFAAGGYYLGTNSLFNEWSSLSGIFGALVMDRGRSAEGTGTALAFGRSSEFDFYVDDSSVDAAGRKLLLTLSMGGLISFGNEDLWFQGGLHRSSFGSFTEGVVLTEQAPQAAAFSLTWNTGNLIYSKYLLGLSATRDNAGFYGNFQQFYPDKYLSGQSFQFLFGKDLEVSLFEEVVFGQRVDLFYLTPVISSLYTSIYTGMKDNILVGGSFRWKLPGSVVLSGLFHADDMHFLKLLVLDTSGKMKLAVNGGLEWLPVQPWLDRISLDYALVTPYTFTHAEEPLNDVYTGINYVNYTHQGKGLSGLEPNSDRIRLKAFWRPAGDLEIFAESRFSRHGNASADFPQYGPESADYIGTSDGGFNDNGYVTPGGDHRYNTNHFLTQSVIETLWRTTLGSSVKIPLPIGDLFLAGSYGLEAGWNRRSLGQTGVYPALENPDWENKRPGFSWSNAGTPVKDNNGLTHLFSLDFRYQF